MRFKLYLFMFFLVSLNANAGQETHGGDILSCPGAGLKTLDYYYATMPSPNNPQPVLEDISHLDANQVIELFRNKLKPSFFSEAFEAAYFEIGDVNQWVVAEGLIDVKDDGLDFQLPVGCKLLQGAVREGSAVFLEKSVLADLPPAQLGMLAVHEILYKLAVEKGRESSATTRQVIRMLLQKNTDYRALESSIRALGWQYSYFEILTDKIGNNLYSETSTAPFPLNLTILDKDPATRKIYVKYNTGELIFWWGYYQCDYSDRCFFDSIDERSDPNYRDYIKPGDYLRFRGLNAVEHHMVREGVDSSYLLKMRHGSAELQ